MAEYKWLYRQICPDRHNWLGNDIGQETIMSEGQNRPKNLMLYKGPVLKDRDSSVRIRLVFVIR